MRSPDKNINPNCPSLEVLLTGMAESCQYDHLRLILSKNNNRQMGQKYLMVSRNAFGLVKLVDLEYSENRILIALQDLNTGLIRSIHLDINDPAFSFLLISWQDIREMMIPDRNTNQGNNDLLEFDF